MNGHENSIIEIKDYLTDPEHPFKPGEFAEWWSSLTPDERDEFKKADLTRQ